jgi:cytochrome c peroxidase
MRLPLVMMCALVGCGGPQDQDEIELGPAPAAPSPVVKAADVNPRLLRRFRPLRQAPPPSPTIVLGKALFFDPRLSRHDDTSCNSCHALDHGGVDRRATSVGDEGHVGSRNAPTVYNAAWHVAQFWDGRAGDLEEQAKGPILNPNEMAMLSPVEVGERLRAVPEYVAMFAAAFPGEPIDFDHVARAIAAFEQTLATPARWDRFLDGDTAALTAAEIDGLKLFADVGCIQCHTGELVGGSMFQKVGLVEPWPDQRDLGRYAVTHLEADRMVFKVPSLRNVAITAPYFHDGSVASLADAVRAMGHHQLGIELTDAEVSAITTWLGTLTGVPTQDIEAPHLPL